MNNLHSIIFRFFLTSRKRSLLEFVLHWTLFLRVSLCYVVINFDRFHACDTNIDWPKAREKNMKIQTDWHKNSRRHTHTMDVYMIQCQVQKTLTNMRLRRHSNAHTHTHAQWLCFIYPDCKYYSVCVLSAFQTNYIILLNRIAEVIRVIHVYILSFIINKYILRSE